VKYFIINYRECQDADSEKAALSYALSNKSSEIEVSINMGFQIFSNNKSYSSL